MHSCYKHLGGAAYRPHCMLLLPLCSRHALQPTCTQALALRGANHTADAGGDRTPVNSGLYMKRGFFRFATLLLRISSSLLLPSDSAPGGARPPAAALAAPALPLLPSCCGRCCCCWWCWPPPSKSPSSLLSSRRYRLAWARCFRRAAWAARCCICFWISAWKFLACSSSHTRGGAGTGCRAHATVPPGMGRPDCSMCCCAQSATRPTV